MPLILSEGLWPVSHSWVAPSERKSVLTTINGKAWRVPIPRTTSLNDIRDELLSLGAEYVFLDVLCLRQEDKLQPEYESIRKREWRLDIPTIGYIYESPPNPVIVYFNGLGIPFRDDAVRADDKFHWFNRVWTLQEFPKSMEIAGGLEGRRLLDLRPRGWEKSGSETFWSRLDEEMEMRKQFRTGFGQNTVLGNVLKRLQGRFSTNPVDEVACLGYLLGCPTLPIYDADMSPEVAWSLLFECLGGELLTALLYSDVTDPRSNLTWKPTWEQIKIDYFSAMIAPDWFSIPWLERLDGSSPDVGYRNGLDAYFHHPYIITKSEYRVIAPVESHHSTTHGSVDFFYGKERVRPHIRAQIYSKWRDCIMEGDVLISSAGVHPFGDGVFIDGTWIVGKMKGKRRIGRGRVAIEVLKIAVLELSRGRDSADPEVGREEYIVYS